MDANRENKINTYIKLQIPHKDRIILLLLTLIGTSQLLLAQYVQKLDFTEPFKSGLSGYSYELVTGSASFKKENVSSFSGSIHIANARSVVGSEGDGASLTFYEVSTEFEPTSVTIDVGLDGLATSSISTKVSQVDFLIYDIDSATTGNAVGTEEVTVQFEVFFEDLLPATSLTDVTVTPTNGKQALTYSNGVFTCTLTEIVLSGATLEISSNLPEKRLRKIYYKEISSAYEGDVMKFQALRTLDQLSVVANSFFTPPLSDPSASLSEDEIYPQGKRLGFGIYSISDTKVMPNYTKTNLERVADFGFTLNGPHYRDTAPESRLTNTANLGMKYTYQILPLDELTVNNIPVPIDDRSGILAGFTDEEIRQGVRDEMDIILNDPIKNVTVARWTLEPEELRHWRSEELRLLRITSDEVGRYDPLRRPFSMYEPTHRQRADLELTAIHQDMVTMGCYVTEDDDAIRAAHVASGVDRIVDTAQAHSTVPQAAFQLSTDFAPGTTDEEVVRKIRHDVFLGFVRGLKSAVIWSGFHNRTGLSTFDLQLNAYGSVATDLNKEGGLAPVFLFGEERDDLELVQLSGISELTYVSPSSVANNKTINTFSLYNAQYGSNRYLIVINSSGSPASCRIDGLPEQIAYEIGDLFDESSLVSLEADHSLHLDFESFETKAFLISSGLSIETSYVSWAEDQGDSSARAENSTFIEGVLNGLAWAFNMDAGEPNYADLFSYDQLSPGYDINLPSKGTQGNLFIESSLDLDRWSPVLGSPIPIGSTGVYSLPRVEGVPKIFYRAFVHPDCE